MIRHFILTRFNLRLWTKDKKQQPTRTSEWLEKRFQLFETFCLPSIKSQSVKNFKWIVLFDESTPAAPCSATAVTSASIATKAPTPSTSPVPTKKLG